MLETTPAIGARLAPWSSAIEEAIPDEVVDWVPDPLSRGFTNERRFRWTVVVGALLLASAAAFGWLRLLAIPAEISESVLEDYTIALQDLSVAAAHMDEALVLAFDPALGTAGAATGPVLAADNAASLALGTATAPLPATPPLLPGNDVEMLQPVRQRVRLAADLATDLTARLGGVVAYRLAWERAFAMPRLPAEGDGRALADLDGALTLAVAETTTAVSAMPDLALMSTHRDAATDLVESLPAWQVNYLTALHLGETEAADAYISSLRGSLEELNGTYAVALESARAELVSSLAQLRSTIDVTRVAVGG